MTGEVRELRRILGQFATGVTVVTTTLDGTPHGLTVNAFSSLSLDPPQVLVCLKRDNRSAPAFARAGHFAVNVLGERQVGLALLFAGPSERKFAGLDHRPAPRSGAPLLGGVHAWLDCAVIDRLHPAGSHDIYIGRLLEHGAGDAPPLVFHGGRYHALGALVESG